MNKYLVNAINIFDHHVYNKYVKKKIFYHELQLLRNTVMNTECRNIQERKHLITDVLRKCEQFLI